MSTISCFAWPTGLYSAREHAPLYSTWTNLVLVHSWYCILELVCAFPLPAEPEFFLMVPVPVPVPSGLLLAD